MSVVHRIEAAAAAAALGLLRRMGPVRASELGGRVARGIGPMLPVSRVAHRNLALALPALDAGARRRIVRGVWDNLGRTAAELAHLRDFAETETGPGWEVVGREHLEAFVARGGPGLFFTGHLGNWEVVVVATARQGLGGVILYRPADNALIDAMIGDLRRAASGPAVTFVAKGALGARQTLQHLRQGGFVGLLQDQKMNDGIAARFFGREAMTASALAALAVKMGCAVLPTYAQRIGPARFRMTYEAPMAAPATGDRTADVAALTQAVNDRLEAWIRATPESWLWLHRRWPKESYANLR